MYLIYFFNAQGNYQVPIYQADMKATLAIVFTYMELVPGIRVTESDEVVFETVRGKVIWPDIERDTLDDVAKAYPPAAKASALDVLPGYITAMDRAISAEPQALELAFSQLRAAEIPLLAYAASEGLNLNEYAYRPAEVVITELSELRPS